MTVSKSMVDDADADAPDGVDAGGGDIRMGIMPEGRGSVTNAKPLSTPIDTHRHPSTFTDIHQQQPSATITGNNHRQQSPTTVTDSNPQQPPAADPEAGEEKTVKPQRVKIRLLQSGKLPDTVTPPVTPYEVELPVKQLKRNPSGGTAYLAGSPSKAREVMTERLTAQSHDPAVTLLPGGGWSRVRLLFEKGFAAA